MATIEDLRIRLAEVEAELVRLRGRRMGAQKKSHLTQALEWERDRLRGALAVLGG